MADPYIKALHIIFIVSWFAGLFYIVRLFVYQTEALAKAEPERSILSKQLKLMAYNLWNIITIPSAIITLILGFNHDLSVPGNVATSIYAHQIDLCTLPICLFFLVLENLQTASKRNSQLHFYSTQNI